MSIFVILWCIRHILFVDVMLHLVWFYRMNWNLLYACAYICISMLSTLETVQLNIYVDSKENYTTFCICIFFYSTNFYSIKAMFWQNLACSIFILIFNDKTRNQFLSCNNFQSNSSSFFYLRFFFQCKQFRTFHDFHSMTKQLKRWE